MWCFFFVFVFFLFFFVFFWLFFFIICSSSLLLLVPRRALLRGCGISWVSFMRLNSFGMSCLPSEKTTIKGKNYSAFLLPSFQKGLCSQESKTGNHKVILLVRV